MSKAWWEGFWLWIGLAWVKDCVMRAVCAIRGKHSWKRTNLDVKHCKICGKNQQVKRRKVKVAYG